METEKDERWYVQFDSGDVRLMTLDELDQAFEAGEVHAQTYLIQVGETNWQSLADVAGLNDESDEESNEEPVAAPAPQPAFAAPAPATFAAPAPAPFTTSVMPAVTASGYPPVISRAPSLNPTPSYARGLESTIPVVADLDFGVDTRSFKSGRKSAFMAAMVAIPLLGGGGYALTRLDQPPEALPKLAAAAPPPATTAARNWSSPPPTEATPAAPAAPTPSSVSDSKSGSDTRLSDDMKKALLSNDSARATLKAPKKTGKTAPVAASRGASKKGGKGPFSASGSKDDPLNPNL
jgi:hypothetical protein